MESSAAAPRLITNAADLARVVEEARSASILAVDVEGNGLFAYRARLCTVQLAWNEGVETRVAIVDTLAVDPAPLTPLLGPTGPIKVLHDFTFDVKLLSDAGVSLLRLVDTSVLARMLGLKATGLASLLASELGITVTKDLQQHDWTRRPLEPAQIGYLASDVLYLVALYDKLLADARTADIEEEVDEECAFKRDTALAPPREKRPSYLRIKGAEALDPASLAILRRLVEERERIAEEWDQPPFKVVGNEVLLSLAHAKPLTMAELGRARRGVSSRLFELGPRLLSAVTAGLADGSVPPADLERGPRVPREVAAAKRATEKRLSAWRRAEAEARHVDDQVVLPGHCLADLVALETPDIEAIAQVRGMGTKRITRYAEHLAAILRNEPSALAPVGPEGAT